MHLLRSVTLVAAAIISGISAAPTVKSRQDTWTPGTLNNTREFYITLSTKAPSLRKYNGWALQAWHTGAGEADPVFVNESPTPAYLNGSSLLFDQSAFPFGVDALPFDDNYGRWEPVTVTAGYGSGPWVNNGTAGLQVDAEESGGWLVCEWYHGDNAPQLFQLINGFDTVGAGIDSFPSTCGRALLIPKWI